MSNDLRSERLLRLASADLPVAELLTLAADIVGQFAAAECTVQEHGADASGVAIGTDAGPVAFLAATGVTDKAFLQAVAITAGVAIARRQREDALARSVRHFTAAQRISHVGSYDFEIATNTNDWSDQLYRIYGREPGSFMATYEKFLEMVHPDDREKIIGVHQDALANIAPYEMEERIVWPDGQMHTLASWGEVVPGPDGAPARMVGICWDITEQKRTAEALARSSERFKRLIQSAPDVVLVVDPSGAVTQVNDRVQDVLGWGPTSVIGRHVTELLPGGVGDGGRPREMTACNVDGAELPVEVSTSEIETPDGVVTAAFVRDLRDRKRSEDLTLRLHDAGVRRRHALEINDNVVQGLASVLYLLDLDRHESAHAAARRTMATARAMMDGLLEEAGPGTLSPGELVREAGHVATLHDIVAPTYSPAPVGALRVLLADDAEDIRLLLRLTLATTDGFDVVGEAANGVEAIELARDLQPDVILLDLSMPVMDGLQAIPEILEASPETKVVVLSGFDETRMKPVALELGAVAYLEKGEATSGVLETLTALFPEHALVVRAEPPLDPEAQSEGGLAFDGDMVVHELRTPLTVITGMLATIRDRIDVLPSATTAELIEASLRNARQMADLLDAVSDARRASNGILSVVPERTDLAQLVRDAVADASAGHAGPRAVVVADPGVSVDVDPARIRQIISNLLSNAFAFSPAGKPITVTVSAAFGSATVIVHDDGPGVPVDRRDELFTKFGRLGRQGQGMGLGLYISRAIARAHGGDLVLQDGPGASFALTLPHHADVEVGTRGR